MRRTSLAARASARAWLLLAVSPGCSADPPTIATVAIARPEPGDSMAGPDLGSSSVAYLRGLAGEIGLAPGDDFVLSSIEEGALRRARLQQRHDGVPVAGSALLVHADAHRILGLSGLVTLDLDGFDVEPSIAAATAAAIARADLAKVAPAVSGQVAAHQLLIRPRAGGGADLAWRIDFAAGWQTWIDAHDGGVLGAGPVADGLCGDGLCLGDESDVTCAADCGCSSQQSLCGVAVPAPFGCWCDTDCAASGDCCADVDVCALAPPNYDDAGSGDCAWGEEDPGFFDEARLGYYRMKYFAIAQGGALMGQEDAARYLLHFLDNSGSEMDIDVDRLLDEVPSFADKVDEERRRFAATVASAADQANATAAVTREIPLEWRSTAVESSESDNWFHALHNFQYADTGKVTVKPAGDDWSFVADGRIHVADYYDWAPEGSYGLFDQGELHELHCYGKAQNFWIRGIGSPRRLEGDVP